MDVRATQPTRPSSEQSSSRQTPTAHRGGMLAELGQVKLLITLWVILSAIALLVVAVRGLGWLSTSQDIKGNEYQVVFLSNDQFYFGKLSRVNDQYVKLTDIYYLQVQQQVQPSNSSGSSSSNPQNVQLVKLGNELHGPEDAMFINRQAVLFWENLKNSGKVAKAIAADKAKK